MFVDLDRPLNASSLLSASAELLVVTSITAQHQNNKKHIHQKHLQLQVFYSKSSFDNWVGKKITNITNFHTFCLCVTESRAVVVCI